MTEPTLYQPTEADHIGGDVYKTPIDGLLYIAREAHKDERGFYVEIARIPEIEAASGEPFVMKQMNLSYSRKNVIRGFHSEYWNKLLTVIDGRCFCAWADFRPESPTFGKVVTMWVGKGPDAHFGSMYVSKGIGNSFCVEEGPLFYLYAVDRLYVDRDTSGDVAVSLFDPDLNVQWPIPREEMVISQRDNESISLRQAFPNKF